MTLKVSQLSKSFSHPSALLFHSKQKTHALKDCTFDLEVGSSLGIVGESGSGKTTLAKILAGHLQKDEGSAMWSGLDLLALDRKKRAKVVQMVFQDPYSSLNPKLLLMTQLYEGRKDIKDAEQTLDDVGLPVDFLQRYPHQLSGGQRQRFAIARALVNEPEILLADEPVSSLDLTIQVQIIALLNNLKSKRKFTLIVISHDLAVIASLCEKTIVMKEGEIVEMGFTKEILRNPTSPYTKRLLDATPVL